MSRPTARERSETERNRAETALLAQRAEQEAVAHEQSTALNNLKLEKSQAQAIANDNTQRMPNVGNFARPNRIFAPSSNRIANGFPPADDLVLLAGVIAIIGNVAKAHKNNSKISPEKWVKLCGAIFLLAIILGLLDRGSLSGPIRALAGLGLLTSILYYTQYIIKK